MLREAIYILCYILWRSPRVYQHCNIHAYNRLELPCVSTVRNSFDCVMMKDPPRLTTSATDVGRTNNDNFFEKIEIVEFYMFILQFCDVVLEKLSDWDAQIRTLFIGNRSSSVSILSIQHLLRCLLFPAKTRMRCLSPPKRVLKFPHRRWKLLSPKRHPKRFLPILFHSSTFLCWNSPKHCYSQAWPPSSSINLASLSRTTTTIIGWLSTPSSNWLTWSAPQLEICFNTFTPQSSWPTMSHTSTSVQLTQKPLLSCRLSYFSLASPWVSVCIVTLPMPPLPRHDSDNLLWDSSRPLRTKEDVSGGQGNMYVITIIAINPRIHILLFNKDLHMHSVDGLWILSIWRNVIWSLWKQDFKCQNCSFWINSIYFQSQLPLQPWSKFLVTNGPLLLTVSSCPCSFVGWLHSCLMSSIIRQTMSRDARVLIILVSWLLLLVRVNMICITRCPPWAEEMIGILLVSFYHHNMCVCSCICCANHVVVVIIDLTSYCPCTDWISLSWMESLGLVWDLR